MILIETLPNYLASIFKLIVLYPIFNQSELVGMLVLFKDASNYVFPKEHSIMQELAIELSIVLTLI